jgi:hypothetical protein
MEQRKLLVQRALEARRLQQQALAGQPDRTDDSEGSQSSMNSSDESSTLSDESSSSSASPVIKFVKKENRYTIVERERKEAELEQEKQREKIEHDMYLQHQRQQILADAIHQDDMVDADDSTDVLRPPTIGDEDTEEAYQEWKIRELKRILRYKGLMEEEQEEDNSLHGEMNVEKSGSSRSLFKKPQSAETLGNEEHVEVVSERAKIGVKFAKKSGGMRDV